MDPLENKLEAYDEIIALIRAKGDICCGGYLEEIIEEIKQLAEKQMEKQNA